MIRFAKGSRRRRQITAMLTFLHRYMDLSSVRASIIACPRKQLMASFGLRVLFGTGLCTIDLGSLRGRHVDGYLWVDSDDGEFGLVLAHELGHLFYEAVAFRLCAFLTDHPLD